MARLQDFQTVTPSGSDKLLIVQSQGQGLSTLDNVVGVKMDKANPTGTGSLSLNRASGSTLGTNAVAVGSNCTASGSASFAEGGANTSSGDFSHSEGNGCVASGTRAHAEGNGTVASGDYSHAEGYICEARGDYGSHAEGNGTISKHVGQHVFGAFNELDPSTNTKGQRGTYIEIVGKGGSSSSRSNARTLDWSGNEVLAGDLTINGNKKLQYVYFDVNVQSQVNPTGLLKEDIIADNFLSAIYQCVQLVNNSTGVIYNAYVRKDNGNLIAGETFPAARYYGQALLICT